MKSFPSIVALVLSLAAIASASAQLILNGSFETPLVPQGSSTNFNGGSTAITGWTVVGVDSSVISGTFQQSGITFQSQSGSQWLDLAGYSSNSPTSGVRQNIATEVGQAYTLSFYVGSATGGGVFFPATVDLSINGDARVSYFNPTGPSNMVNWKLFTVSFTATSATTSLTFLNGSASNNFLCGLDNVTLAPVGPAPSLDTIKQQLDLGTPRLLKLSGYTDQPFTVQRSTGLGVWQDWRLLNPSDLPIDLDVSLIPLPDKQFFRLKR